VLAYPQGFIVISQRIAIAAFLLAAATSRLSVAQTPDANQLLREVQAKYAAMRTYSDVGEVRGTVVMTAPDDLAQGNGPQEVPAGTIHD
jgi:hypothetical protein